MDRPEREPGCSSFPLAGDPVVVTRGRLQAMATVDVSTTASRLDLLRGQTEAGLPRRDACGCRRVRTLPHTESVL
ncbi:hypothetical protein [Streptomyces sp. NRRL B-24572]|uniref:hypothetical protein n=1 Tax=Streptomyces sp. NRRL B-24572 TaxID=1962156 RepID=UPI00117CEACB|nr:hypothetical protein [Streptomyces sp. NRRL B-24572]